MAHGNDVTHNTAACAGGPAFSAGAGHAAPFHPLPPSSPRPTEQPRLGGTRPGPAESPPALLWLLRLRGLLGLLRPEPTPPG